VIGVFLSIPVMAALRIVWRAWRTYRTPMAGFAVPQPTEESSTVPMTVEARPMRNR
jgi:predicted PurR-regulated permease PerM